MKLHSKLAAFAAVLALGIAPAAAFAGANSHSGAHAAKAAARKAAIALCKEQYKGVKQRGKLGFSGCIRSAVKTENGSSKSPAQLCRLVLGPKARNHVNDHDQKADKGKGTAANTDLDANGKDLDTEWSMCVTAAAQSGQQILSPGGSPTVTGTTPTVTTLTTTTPGNHGKPGNQGA